MFCTISSVAIYRNDLSPIQKKRWVEVANATFKKEKGNGHDSKECEDAAIGSANAAMLTFKTALFLEGPLVNIKRIEIFKTG